MMNLYLKLDKICDINKTDNKINKIKENFIE